MRTFLLPFLIACSGTEKTVNVNNATPEATITSHNDGDVVFMDDPIEFRATVTDDNDAPIITSDGGGATAALNVVENTTAVTSITYSDQDVPADSISYSLSGADAGLFTIDGSGNLSFIAPPDFETPRPA